MKESDALCEKHRSHDKKCVCGSWSSTNTRFNPSSDMKVGPPTRESKHNKGKSNH